MKSIEIKDGKHKGELGVVIETQSDGSQKTLTLEGDIHFYNQEGYEEMTGKTIEVTEER